MNLGWRTDVEVLRLTGSEVEDRGDHLVVRSPHTPLFHWGNFVLVTDPAATEDAPRWLAVFEQAFPTAGHRAFGLPALPVGDAWQRAGLQIETSDVLATGTVPEQRPAPEGYAVRPFADADWERWVAMESEENRRTGEHPEAAHEVFLRDQARTRAGMVTQGHSAWFGAFAPDGGLASSLGVVRCGELARYQSVSTDERHRRRGLAGHLLGVAARWGAEQGCRTWVIVTETTNDAGRLYRSVGFEPDRVGVEAYRKPPR